MADLLPDLTYRNPINDPLAALRTDGITAFVRDTAVQNTGPTSDPFHSQYDFLRYPIDLGSNPAHNHYVVFYINSTVTNTGFSTATGSRSLDYNPKFVDADVSQINRNRENDGNVVMQHNTKRLNRAIALYMPPFENSDAANWEEENLEYGGTAIDALFGSGSKSDRLKSAFKDIAMRVTNNASIGIDNEAIKGFAPALRSAARVAYNPHAEILYNGQKFRSFEFEFQFVPTSEQEAIEVLRIIQTLRFHAAPDINAGNLGRWFLYPDEFDIKFYSNNRENEFLNRLSTCALTNIRTNYAPKQIWTAFQASTLNGAPTEISMTLSFTELELITKQRIREGF